MVRHGWLAAVVISLVGAATAPAQFDPARKAEADIKLALKEAVRWADADPTKGADKLRKVLQQIESDVSLPADRRAQLARVVKDRLRVTESGPDAAAVAATEAKLADRAAATARQIEETAQLKAGLKAAIALEKDGKPAEAKAKLEDLFRQFKDHAAVQAVRLTENVAQARRDIADTRVKKEQKNNDALNSIDRAAVTPGRDMEYSKDWKERMALRKAANAPTAEELKILKALNTTLSPNFKDTKLEDAMDYLSTLTGLTIILDKASLDEMSLTYTTPVTFVVKTPLAVRSTLRGMFSGMGLTYVVRDGIVWVTTPARAREFLVTKTYPVGDLAVPIDFGPWAGAQEAFNVVSLIQLMVTSIEPESWESRGGPGTIRYYAPTRSLVIRQSAEVHTMVKGSLNK